MDAHNCGQFAAVLPVTCGISLTISEFLRRHDPPPSSRNKTLARVIAMLFKRLLHDHAAGVAPLLGLCIIPMVGAAGAAIDYSRAASVRTSMQMALDST